MQVSGLLNLHKPVGVTSRQVVDQVDRLVRPAKAGHAGTLDPLASGVLVVCVGAATRLIDYVQRMPKRYVGTFLLGRQSPTEDIEGEVELLDNPPQPTREKI
jgi:tRNA pseudouridine55 synthase